MKLGDFVVEQYIRQLEPKDPSLFTLYYAVTEKIVTWLYSLAVF